MNGPFQNFDFHVLKLPCSPKGSGQPKSGAAAAATGIGAATGAASILRGLPRTLTTPLCAEASEAASEATSAKHKTADCFMAAALPSFLHSQLLLSLIE